VASWPGGRDETAARQHPRVRNSEHGPALVSTDQAYVTRLINVVMRGPDWNSCAIFVTWDDWGGFYDHIRPPYVDHQVYGFRVPGLMISPYAKHGFIDHQRMSSGAHLKFIEVGAVAAPLLSLPGNLDLR
jgi:phospholipase C